MHPKTSGTNRVSLGSARIHELDSRELRSAEIYQPKLSARFSPLDLCVARSRDSEGGPRRRNSASIVAVLTVILITLTLGSTAVLSASPGGGTATSPGALASQLPHLPFGKGKNKSGGANAKVRLAMQAVGAVLVRDAAQGSARQEPWARGSGVVVSKDGIIATNMHVLLHDQSDRPFDEIFFVLPDKGAQSLEGGRRYSAKVLSVWREYDLALLKISSNPGAAGGEKFPAVELADSRKTQVLDPLTVIGYPETGGTTVTISTGVVQGNDPADGWIKTDARLIHGNSGGAAVNADGKLVGIPTKVIVDEDKGQAFGAVGFLRPSQFVAAMLGSVKGPGGKQSKQKAASAAAPQGMQGPSFNGPQAPSVNGPQAPSYGQPPSYGQGQGNSQSSGYGQTPNNGQGPGSGQAPGNGQGSYRNQTDEPGSIKLVGVVRSGADMKPVAGVRVGLVILGSSEVTSATLITWGGTNADGVFEMNTRVRPGRYTLKAQAIGYQPTSRDIEINEQSGPVVIELQPAR